MAVNGRSTSMLRNGDDDYLPYPATKKLNVVVVGAGIAGLALESILGKSGHEVTVLEGAPQIAEVGAGINCSPNLTRLLHRWGLDAGVRKHSNSLSRIDLRRWKDGEFLGAATVMPEVERRHGAPQYAIHRADLHNALMIEAGRVCKILVNSRVVDVDFDKPSVTLSNGDILTTDVVVGADGMKSTCRKLLYERLGLVDRATPTGDAAFRASVPLELIQDPELRAFVIEGVATRWMGPERHIQAYPIRGNSLYNMVMCHPDTGFSEESWTAIASKQEILDHYGSWDQGRLGKLLALIPDQNVMKWRLCSHEPLPTWVMGKAALLGDACHPMLPYVAQGAAQALEDVAALGQALNRLRSTSDIPVYLKAYELSRKSHAETVASTATVTRRVLHLPDGAEQEARDEKFRAVAKGGENPDLLGDQKAQAFLWGHDPEREFIDQAQDLLQKAQQQLK